MDSFIKERFTVDKYVYKALTVVNMDSLIQEVFTVDKSVQGSDSC